MRKAYAIVLSICIVFVLTACDGYAVLRRYPEYKSLDWYCEELDFSFSYEENEYGNLELKTGSLTVGTDVLDVDLFFMIDNWSLVLDKGDEMMTTDDILAEGTWRYRKGNLVFTITEDNLFDGMYDELMFVPIKSK